VFKKHLIYIYIFKKTYFKNNYAKYGCTIYKYANSKVMNNITDIQNNGQL